MGKYHNSIVVLPIGLKFWRMMPMALKTNHKKSEPQTQWGRPGTRVASGGPPLQNCHARANTTFLCRKPL